MNTEHILALLIAERDKLNRAIEALGAPVRRGRPPKNPFSAVVAAPAKAASKRRGLSPAKRKAQSERMKAYWAKRKKQPATRLSAPVETSVSKNDAIRKKISLPRVS
jgi:hypothetical protein